MKLPATRAWSSESVTPSSEALIGRLHAGDAEAAAQVFRQFAERVLNLASGRLGRILRPKAEPEDVVQSVFRSFFARQRQGQFDLHGWDSLWDVLVVITLRKCCNRAEFFQAARRDVRRETSLQAAGAAGLLGQAVAREPGPAEAAELAGLVERLLQAFAERERAVLGPPGTLSPAPGRRRSRRPGQLVAGRAAQRLGPGRP
jgi:RNA polymerase sigma-70 factor, ECF subfamily